MEINPIMRKLFVTTAGNMSDETYKLICDKTQEKFAENFEFVRIDKPEILGGFILNLDDEIYDLSIKSQLEKFKDYVG